MSNDARVLSNSRRVAWTRWVMLLIFGAFICVGLGYKLRRRNTPALPQLPPVVTVLDRQHAREAFELKYGRSPDRNDLLSFLAEFYLSRGRLADAVECFHEIPTSHSAYGPMARFQQGRTLLKLHRAVEAEPQFRELIAHEEKSLTIAPNYLVDARQRLRFILEVELRLEERKQLLAGVIERGEANHFETIVFCFPSHLRWNGNAAVKWLEEFHAADPTARSLNIALGRYRTGQGKLDEARTLLEPIVKNFPEDRRALAALIACLQESDESAEADRLIEGLPLQSASDPWLLLLQRGGHALRRGLTDKAAKAYDELLAQDRTNTEAWQKTAMIGRIQNDETKRKRAIDVATGLSRIQNHIGKGIQRPEDPNSFLDIADLCAEIEFDAEGLILTKFAEKLSPENPRAMAAIKLFQSRMSAVSDRTK